jgi:outer membrane receptor protein involved in Fe transport
MTKYLAAVTVCLVAARAGAQQIEVPVLVLDSPEAETGDVDTELNLANLVQTAAKGVTTVQEAPAIITIIPGDELADRNTRNLEEAIDRVPGWFRYGAVFSQFPSVNPRGTFQATLFLRDSVSMFDSMVNIATVSRVQPLETVKRLEIITGPGGVLWGANSFLGVVNVITKDAEDVNGLEASVGGGTGNGDKDVLRGYVMAGLPKLLDGKLKLFAHASFETYQGPIYTYPGHLYGSPTPQPNGLSIYGADTTSDPKQSMIFYFDGKLAAGPFTFLWAYPVAQRYFGVGFPGNVVREHLPEDDLPQCSQVPRSDPNVANANDSCADRARAYRSDHINFFERYGILEYKTRFAENKAGLTARGYFIQFVRDFEPLAILNPIPGFLEGGLSFNADFTNYRVGGTVDGDVELGQTLRLTYGLEAFREWLPSNVTSALQGDGIEATFEGPYNLSLLPLACPRQATWDGSNITNVSFVPGCPLTFAFKADRVVFGGFVSLQWRPTPRLILDAGIRGQVAPTGLGKRGYDPVPLGSAAVVYEFIPDWHVKLNVTQGFRPPVFNNTDSNGQAVELAGNPNLKVETSAAFQAEINARLLKGRRRIRELDLRADVSYTRLDNEILVNNGSYQNGQPRGITSAEFLAKLYLKGDHRLELGYTWLQTVTADKGILKSNPEHWFNLGGVVSIIPRTLELNANLRVFGAFEDPNTRIETRDLIFDPLSGNSFLSQPGQTVSVTPTENVMDRIPPTAELQVGVRVRTLKDKLVFTASAYNVFNARLYQPDAFYDFEPRLEYTPNLYEDFRFFATATVSY